MVPALIKLIVLKGGEAQAQSQHRTKGPRCTEEKDCKLSVESGNFFTQCHEVDFFPVHFVLISQNCLRQCFYMCKLVLMGEVLINQYIDSDYSFHIFFHVDLLYLGEMIHVLIRKFLNPQTKITPSLWQFHAYWGCDKVCERLGTDRHIGITWPLCAGQLCLSLNNWFCQIQNCHLSSASYKTG